MKKHRLAAGRGPVFVVGAPFSGVNVLQWAIAAHPAFTTSHLGLAREALADLAAATSSYLVSAERALSRLLAETPPADSTADAHAHALAVHIKRVGWLKRGRGRLVIGGSVLTHHVLTLARLFPDATFVHAVRDVRLSVAAAAAAREDDGAQTAGMLSRDWLQHVQAGLEAERALGSRRVIRVEHGAFARNGELAFKSLLKRLQAQPNADGLAAARLMVGGPDPGVLTDAQLRAIDSSALAVSTSLQAHRGRSASLEELLQRLSPGPVQIDTGAQVARTDANRRVHEVVRAIPGSATVLVISKGDEDLVDFADHRGWHYPGTASGEYLGYHPADGVDAVARLKDAVEAGAGYFVVPEPYRWYLMHYGELSQWLFGHCSLWAADKGTLVFALNGAAVHEAGEVTVRAPSKARLHAQPADPDLSGALAIVDRVPPRLSRRRLPGSLWAVTAYYNPARYANKSQNYRLFVERLRAQGVPLLTMEVAFAGQQFELTAADADRVVHLRGRDVLWQKERILNLALPHLPADCDKVAWVDGDVLFAQDDWAEETARLLGRHVIVQPFSHSVRLPPGARAADPAALAFGHDDNRMMHGMAFGVATKGRGALQRFRLHGHTGYGWAARREILERHGLYEANLLGNGDADVAYAMFRHDTYWSLQRLGPAAQQHLREWADGFGRSVDGSVAYVPGLVLHLWHGSLKHREYDKALDVLHDFNPRTDLVVNPESGLFEWAAASERLRHWSLDYFVNRREEGDGR